MTSQNRMFDDTLPDVPRDPVQDGTQPETQHLPLDLILASPYQPRLRKLRKAELEELIDSIRANGQISPIIVTPGKGEHAGKFHVHSGHRRCEALRYLEARTVLAVIRRDLDERGQRKLALADNLGREDLTVAEQAKALHDYCQTYDLSTEEGGKELGITRSVAFRLRTIGTGPERLLELFGDTRFSVATAVELAKLAAKQEKRAIRLAEKLVAGKLTVTALKAAVDAARGAKKAAATVGDDVTLTVNKGRLRLALNVQADACTESQRDRIRHALAQAMAQLGIDSIDARAVERRAG